MDTLLLVFRIILIVIGALVSIVYILFQLFQKIKQNKFEMATADYIVLATVSFIFGFGCNSYFGLLAFVPLLIIKFISRFILKPQKLRGTGRWVEVNWRKLPPRGFDRNIPKAVLEEMNRMPKDNHFVIPRFYMLVFVKFMSNRMTKEMNKTPKGVSTSQQQMAMGEFTGLIDRVVKLPKGQTEKKDFPFGVLKVTRL